MGCPNLRTQGVLSFVGLGFAKVYCEADDAILCRPCDTRIHSANKLASRHIRVEINRRPNAPLGNCLDHNGSEADMYCTAPWRRTDSFLRTGFEKVLESNIATGKILLAVKI